MKQKQKLYTVYNNPGLLYKILGKDSIKNPSSFLLVVYTEVNLNLLYYAAVQCNGTEEIYLEWRK